VVGRPEEKSSIYEVSNTGFWDAIENLSKVTQVVIGISSVAAIVTSAVVVKKVVFNPVANSAKLSPVDLSKISIGADHENQIGRM